MSLFWFDKSAHLGFLDCFSTRANKRLAVRGFISAWFPNAVVIVVLCPGFFCSYSYPSLPPLLLLPSILLLPPLLAFTSSSFIFVFFLSHLPCSPYTQTAPDHYVLDVQSSWHHPLFSSFLLLSVQMNPIQSTILREDSIIFSVSSTPINPIVTHNDF